MAFKITWQWILAHRTDNKGFTLKQAKALGVSWPLPHRWIDTMIGKEITEEQKTAFEAGRFQFAASTLEDRTKHFLAMAENGVRHRGGNGERDLSPESLNALLTLRCRCEHCDQRFMSAAVYDAHRIDGQCDMKRLQLLTSGRWAGYWEWALSEAQP